MNNKTENLLNKLSERSDNPPTSNKWWENFKAPKLDSKIVLSTLGAAAVIGGGIAYYYTRNKS